MQDMLQYVKWRGDLPFSVDTQNEIDALILSEISYVPLDEIVPTEPNEAITLEKAAEMFFEKNGEDFSLGAILPKEILTLFREASHSKRFSNIKLWGYVNEICLENEKQFSAIAFSCENKITYVVYRGTDDTIIGWKEDLNMALFMPIPSQQAGVKYLEDIIGRTKDKIIVSGHSKGGNISVYSALKASSKAQKRILVAYSFDGPGFKEEFLDTVRDEKIVEKIVTFLPTKSVVGRIFDIVGDYRIVRSFDKGIQQHNAFTWLVSKTKFEMSDEFEKPSDNFHELLKIWVSKLTPEQRHEFVDSFYKIATSSDASTLTDITSKKFKFILGLLKSKGSHKKAVIDAVFKLIKERNAMNANEKRERKRRKNSKKSTDE